MIEKIKNISLNIYDEIIQIRHHLHKHPELSFEEFNTSKSIQDFLKVSFMITMKRKKVVLHYYLSHS